MHPTAAARAKYPRTPHLPSSPGADQDDVRLTDLSALRAGEIVLTEKMDGENTTIGAGYTHARSLDSGPHPSRTWVRALAARLAPDLPPDLRVCGENLFARHSVGYRQLPSYFLVFGIWQGERCLDWDTTLEWCALLDLHHVPVFHRGGFPAGGEPELLACWRSHRDESSSEGFVVRSTAGFGRAEFDRRVGKWVRPRHVRTGQHWMTAEVVPNGLAPPP